MCQRKLSGRYDLIDQMFREVEKYDDDLLGYFMYKLSTVPDLIDDLEAVTAFLRSKRMHPAASRAPLGPWIALSWWHPYKRGASISTVGRRGERLTYWAREPSELSVMGKTVPRESVRYWSSEENAEKGLRSHRSSHLTWLICREVDAERRILDIVVGIYDN